MHVIDSHTEGEPTRVIVEGGPPLGTGSLVEQRQIFARSFDSYRSFAVSEPRGYDALVGALLCPPRDPTCVAGAIFFNNVGYLGMCGHGAIGVAVTLAHLGRIGPGTHRLETPVGTVQVDLAAGNEVTIENVASYRHRAAVTVEVPGIGPLTRQAEAVMAALRAQGITGADDAPIDHIEFYGPPRRPGADSRNFVLCPGGAYDRSPCGTGTSAKVACLAAAGKLAPGKTWVQESIVGSRFTACYRRDASGAIIPSITGRAFVTGEATLLRHPDDPFGNGLPAAR